MKKLSAKFIKIVLPLLLGGVILYWMYRDFDFHSISDVLFHKMNWMWMLLSFPFGISAQAFRGWRWRQTLEPIGEKPRTSTAVYSIFLSYAVSLIVPRMGEFARCGVLKHYDGVSFPKAIGTVVTERAIDSLLVLLIALLTFLSQLRVSLTKPARGLIPSLPISRLQVGWLLPSVASQFLFCSTIFSVGCAL